MKRLLLLFALFATPCFSPVLLAGEYDNVEVIEDRNNLTTELRVRGTDGTIAMSDVFRAVSRYSGYDDSTIRGTLPKGPIKLNGRMARWTLAAFNRVMRPCAEATAERDSLRVVVDREAVQQWMHDCKGDFRKAWATIDWRSEVPNYGLEMLSVCAESTPEGGSEAQQNTKQSDLVILIHGLNSYPEDLAGLVSIAEGVGYEVASLRYPNDQPITASAKLLASELIEIRNRFPNRKVRLLTHSMGGLVARAVVETDLDPGNVSQLIMIAPPNQGSSLACVASFMDCYEFFTNAEKRRGSALVEFVSDGLGEATADISPGSVFLDRLNGLERNPNVDYTILIGTGGPMEEDELNELRTTVRDYTDTNRFTCFVSSKLNRALDDLDEVVAGKGDGAVASARAKLDGVRDVVVFPFSHASILNPTAKHSSQAYALIRDRIAKARKGNLPYPQRAIRTHDYLYIRNFKPDRYPKGGSQFHK